MTVHDIFALRKQGKFEEAYEAIRPIYASHKGKYTTLCMFWTATDIFKLRLDQKRLDEAEKIYKALQRMLPKIEEIEAQDAQAASQQEESKARPKVSAAGFMHYAEGRLIKESEKFRKRYFAIKAASKQEAPEAKIIPSESLEGLNIPSDVISSAVERSLNQGQQSVYDCIQQNPGLKVPGISDETGIPAKSVERHIKALIALHLIEHRGSKKTGGYYAK